MFDDFMQALQSAGNIKETGEFADIDKQFAETFRAPVTQQAIGGIEDRAETANTNAERARQAELDKLKEQIQLEKDKLDPKKYQKVVNVEDGGYDFLDPEGNKISPIEYAQITGKSVLEVMKDSSRQTDEDFRLDYEAMVDLNSAIETGTLDDFFGTYDNLAPIRKDLEKMNNAELLDLLAQQHPRYFDVEAEDEPVPTFTAPDESTFDKLLDFFTGPGSRTPSGGDVLEFPGFGAELVQRGNRFE